MKAYILSVCGAVIVSSLVAILLPEGRTGKFINGILKLFCLLVMLIPFFSFVRGFEFSGSGESASEIELDDAFMDSFYNARAEQEEAMLRSRLEEEYSLTLSVQIEWDIVEYEYKI